MAAEALRPFRETDGMPLSLPLAVFPAAHYPDITDTYIEIAAIVLKLRT
jgi:hypothetical protein